MTNDNPRKRKDQPKLPVVVRIVKALTDASRAVDRIEAKYDLKAEQRLQLRAQLHKKMERRIADEKFEAARLPPKPPELWADREGRKENPIAFIRRVYARWLGRGLRRGDIRSLDQPLYQALAVWMHRHPEEDFVELGIECPGAVEEPMLKERNWAEGMRKVGRRSAKQPTDK